MQQCPCTPASVLLRCRSPPWLAHSCRHDKLHAGHRGGVSRPLGGRGHHRALARQAGAGLPEVKGRRASRSCAKPSFPLKGEPSAVAWHSRCVCIPGRVVSGDEPCLGWQCRWQPRPRAPALIPGPPYAQFVMAPWGHHRAWTKCPQCSGVNGQRERPGVWPGAAEQPGRLSRGGTAGVAQSGWHSQGGTAGVSRLRPRLRPGEGADAGAAEQPAGVGAMTGGRGRHRAWLQPMARSVGQRNVCAG